jgi:hypothetical protein
MNLRELRRIAEQRGVSHPTKLNKRDLIAAIRATVS